MSTLRFAIIGLGHFGRRHALTCATVDGVELVAAVDPRGEVPPELPSLPVLTSLDALFEREFDAAIVAAPPAANPQIAERLAALGVHALFEKPLGCATAAAERVRDIYAGTRLVAGVGHVERFNPAASALRRAILAEHVGRLRALRALRCGPAPHRSWELSPGLDLAIHDVDLLAWIGGSLSPPRASIARREWLHAAGMVGRGVPFTLFADRRRRARVRRLTAICDDGVLIADLLRGTLTRGFDGRPSPLADSASPLHREHEGFRDAILRRPNAEVVPLDAGVAAVRFITQAENA